MVVAVAINPSVYVTIDPGLNPGWSIWAAYELVACGLGDPRSHRRHVVTSANPDADTIGDAWIEAQKIYPRSKVDPNDIVTLARDAGRWAGRYDACGVDVQFVEPVVWKGQVPKETHHARIWAALTADEQEVVSLSLKGVAPKKRHNVLDAIGIGLWVARFVR